MIEPAFLRDRDGDPADGMSFAGADYGGGVGLLRDRANSRLAAEDDARAIAPVWEANHVWLIIVVVILFTAFPPRSRGSHRAARAVALAPGIVPADGVNLFAPAAR